MHIAVQFIATMSASIPIAPISMFEDPLCNINWQLFRYDVRSLYYGHIVNNSLYCYSRYQYSFVMVLHHYDCRELLALTNVQ